MLEGYIFPPRSYTHSHCKACRDLADLQVLCEGPLRLSHLSSPQVISGCSLFAHSDLFYQGLGVEPSTRLTTWGNSSAIDGEQDHSAAAPVALAHDGPVLTNDHVLDPAGAVTARTVEAGPSQVGEGFPGSDVLSTVEDKANGNGKRRNDGGVSRFLFIIDRRGLAESPWLGK